MNACGQGCGFCGMCDDDDPAVRDHDEDADSGCAVCAGTLGLLRVTVGGVGRVCSAACADAAVNLSLQLEALS